MPDIAWLRPDGTEMQPEDWDSGFGRAVGVFLNGDGIRERDRRGEPIADKHFIVLFNAGDDDVDFHIPAVEYSPRWDILVDTAGRAGRHATRSSRARRSSCTPRRCSCCWSTAAPEPEIDHSVAASLAGIKRRPTPDDMPSPSPKSELSR